jgi:hypothetical protein
MPPNAAPGSSDSPAMIFAVDDVAGPVLREIVETALVDCLKVVSRLPPHFCTNFDVG